jgi:cell wall-associated NlpC family hydrolase
MTLGKLVAAEAVTWVDTPFKWGQSLKGCGCDCKGLVAGVARELNLPEADSFYATFANYRVDRAPPASLLIEGMASLFDRVLIMQIGDVLLLNHGTHPGHMAIYIGNDRVVHAYPSTKAKVQERDLDVLLYRYPLHSVWRWRQA